jgi:tetratricopeptide (TPR) repeat protein
MQVDTLSFIGSVHLDLRQYERAERCLRDVFELDPSCPVAWFNLAHALQRQNRHREALDASRRAQALRPESGAYRVQLGALLASVVDREKGEAEIRAGAQQLDLAGLPRKFDRIWRWIAARLLGDKEAATRVEALLWPPETVHCCPAGRNSYILRTTSWLSMIANRGPDGAKPAAVLARLSSDAKADAEREATTGRRGERVP